MPLYGELPEIKTADDKTVHGFPYLHPNPPKTAVLRLPTSEEMLSRLSKHITIQQDLGRGQSRAHVVQGETHDLALFKKLRLDENGPEFDEFEASKAISRLTWCSITSREKTGNSYEITLDTYAGPTTHIVEIPYECDMAKYRRAIVVPRNLGRGKTELRYNHSAAIELYDKYVQRADGYEIRQTDSLSTPKSDAVTVVPSHHKFYVMLEVADAVDEIDPPLDPNS